MTKQEQIDNAELVEQAKALKTPSWHLKSVSRVAEEVEKELKERDSKPEPEVVEPVEVKAPAEQKRKRAPKMSVSSINEDSRAQLLRKLNAEDPECHYKFETAGISDEKLLAKGFERTGYSLKNDIVVRTDRESYLANKAARGAHQQRLMESIDTDGDKIQSLTESPKMGKT